mmetsp:Transcript_30145/g.93243  ORF Transcript_30145/g.93243 Transcript_30145/m.93243 type:complete len:158 (-) Transcript_30145:137-610(-)
MLPAHNFSPPPPPRVAGSPVGVSDFSPSSSPAARRPRTKSLLREVRPGALLSLRRRRPARPTTPEPPPPSEMVTPPPPSPARVWKMRGKKPAAPPLPRPVAAAPAPSAPMAIPGAVVPVVSSETLGESIDSIDDYDHFVYMDCETPPSSLTTGQLWG